MKKTKLLTLSLVIAIILMGAGYAAWQERLQIDNVVATGKLAIEFQSDVIHPIFGSFDNLLLEDDYFGFTEVDQDTNTVSVTVDGLYPGTTFLYDLRAKNVGTIPAIVEDVTVDLSKTNDLLDENLRVSGFVTHLTKKKVPIFGDVDWLENFIPIIDIKLSELETVLDGMKGWNIKIGDNILFDVPRADYHNLPENLDEIKQAIANAVPGYDPESNNCLIYHLPYSTGNDLQNLSSQQFDLTFSFKQFNK